MPSTCVVYRFPDGRSEYHFVGKHPEPGDAFVRNERPYMVTSVEFDRYGTVVAVLRFDDEAVEAAWLRE
jgi:hypothetical protein